VTEFKHLSTLSRGSILGMLERFYAAYSYPADGELEAEWRRDWQSYDRLVFDNLGTVGGAGFASYEDGTLVGFCSWDPRGGLNKVLVGHNGILPESRGRGYGSSQIAHMTELLRERGFTKAFVATGAEAFFAPARKMYEGRGFHEIERFAKSGQRLVRYEKTL